LRIDPLEARCLLSITPATLSALIVNETFGGAQTTTTTHSVASDNSGDFVVTWTRSDSVLDAFGNPIINPATGGPYQVTNVYARYFTDTVEQITLPAGTSRFSLTDNDQTIDEISVTAGTAPLGDPSPPLDPNIFGTFTLWFDANGNGVIDPNETLTVNYDETAPTAAAQQIQSWLNSFSPVTTAAGVAVSDATHAIVNAIDPHTFVVDFGTATEGLDQSSLLHYVGPNTSNAVNSSVAQELTFSPTGFGATNGTFELQVGTFTTSPITFSSNSTTLLNNIQAALASTGATVTPLAAPLSYSVTFASAEPPINYVALPLPVDFSNSVFAPNTTQQLTFTDTGSGPAVGQFALQVGAVETAPINFDGTSASTLTITAANIQNALVTAGFNGVTVTTTSTASPYVFNVKFPAAMPPAQPESPIQYVPVPLAVSFSNSVAGLSLSGFLPTVAVTTLDRPFTINNIPVSPTYPDLTAEAIASYFQPPTVAGATAVAPFDFPPPNIATSVTDTQAPYTEPVATNTTIVTTPQTFVTVRPVAGADGELSLTQFDVTFNGYVDGGAGSTSESESGATVDAKMVVNNCVSATGAVLSTAPLNSEGVPYNPPGAAPQVTILKESGNEFQVNPPQPNSIYTQNIIGLNSDQPAVAMDGTGNFVIAWREQVASEVAPKNVTDIYFRRYGPVGLTDSYSGAFVPGEVTSDVPNEPFTGVRLLANPTQPLDFLTTTTSVVTGTFQLQVGALLTGAIDFDSSNLPGTAVNIQNALIAEGYNGATVSVVSLGTALGYSFDITFNSATPNVNLPAIEYVPGTLPSTVTFVPVQDPYTQTANVNYTNPQYDPAVAMDSYGNFVIVWSNLGQDVSWFNNVSMERYDKNGNPIAFVGEVNTGGALTNLDYSPDVAIGYDGSVVVTWSETDDANYQQDPTAPSEVYVCAFSPQSTPLWNEVAVSAGSYSTVAMDGQDNFIVAWQNYSDSDVNGQTSDGIYAEEYQLESYTNGPGSPATGTPLAAPALLRNLFRVNSGSTNTASQTIWPFDQTAADVQMGIGGDIAATYQGYGPATSENIFIPASFFKSYFSSQQVQQIAFNFTAGVPSFATNNQFSLLVGSVPVGPITFNSSATTTATAIQRALISEGFTKTTVSGVLSSNTYVFTVTFNLSVNEPSIQYVAAATNPLPSTLSFTQNTTGQVMNADLLPYFNPSQGGSLPGAYSSPYLYSGGNDNVDSAIDQVLMNAEQEGASDEQLGRLQAILNNVAGLLRGDSDGVLMSEWDANPEDSQNATYSDNIVNTQRAGQDQRWYITIPTDVQQGTFQLKITVGPLIDGVGYTFTTAAITMPSTVPAAPGGIIDVTKTMDNIAIAIDAALGSIWPANPVYPDAGAVDVRMVPPTEVAARNGTYFQVPAATILAEQPTVFPPVTTPPTLSSVQPPVIFELLFQGQTHDIPLISMSVVNVTDQQWVDVPTQSGSPPTVTYTETQIGASPVAATPGDYSGVQGPEQYNASLAMTSAGSMVAAYTNQALQTDGFPPSDAYGNPTYSNIYAEPLEETTDTAGPQIVGLTDANGVDLIPDMNGTVNLTGASATGVNAQYFVLTFNEPMLADDPVIDPDSVFNSANYEIYNSAGNQIGGVVAQVNYGLSELATLYQTPGFNLNPSLNPEIVPNPNAAIPDNRWEVVLTLNDNGETLPNGTYTLVVRNAIPASSTSAGQIGLRNIYGTPLNLTGFNPSGSNFTATFSISNSTNPGSSPTSPGLTATNTPINSTRGGEQIDPAVATGPSGKYVVVWTSIIAGQSNIVGQLYNPSGVPIGTEFTINSTASTSWGQPDVAMDALGDFVVVWSGAGPNSNPTTDPSDIFARQYNAQGQSLTPQFLVDQYVLGVQLPGVQGQARIALSPDGTFVITWTSTPITITNQNTANSAIFAREYNSLSVPLGNEFQVTPSSLYARTLSDVAIDSNDDFVVIWQGYAQNPYLGIYGDYFTAQATTSPPTTWSQTGPVLLNGTLNLGGSFTGITTIDLHATGPRVAMAPTHSGVPAGFAVTWSSFNASSTTGYNVYAQIFRAGGVAAGGPFQVNENYTTIDGYPATIGWQVMPAVSIDEAGHITVVWASYGQDNAENGNPLILDYGVYARLYNSDGSDYVDPTLGNAPKEFRVNATTLGNQLAPAVASNNPNDDSIIAWVGPDTAAAGTTAIYLRVIDPPPPAVALSVVNSAPVVTTNPSNQTVDVGQSVAFTAVASGTPAPTVEWQVSTNDGATYSSISGATSTTYDFSATSAESGDLYRAVFTNSKGQVTSTAATLTVTVNSSPVVRVNPLSQAVDVGQSVTFTAAASGTPSPTVQWEMSANGVSYTAIAGATSTTYSFTPTAAQSGDKYCAVFTNVFGTVTTTAATLTVNTVPVVTTNPTSQVLNAGQTVSFTAAASGTPVPSVEWQVLATEPGSQYVTIPGATSTTYTFSVIAAQSGNLYRAVFTNAAGTATTTAATLTVNSPPVVTTNPSNQTVFAGQSVSFTAAAAPTPAATVQWQLSSNGGQSYSNISGATSTTYTFTATTAESGDRYRAVFTDAAGITATTTAATLTVDSPPIVTANPSSPTVNAGLPVSFTAAATGASMPSAQWQVSTNGGATYTNISGSTTSPATTPRSLTVSPGESISFTAAATSTTYTFIATAAESGYMYRAVFVSMDGSTATTFPATLTVNTAPVVTTNPSNKAVSAGQSVSFTAAATSTPAPTVQWQVLAPGGASYANIPGATSTTYTFTAGAAQSGDLYRAVFTNAAGQATTSAATLTIETTGGVVVPSVVPHSSPFSTKPIQASTVTGPEVLRLSGSTKPASTSLSSSALTVLHPAAVAIVMTRRLS